MWWFSHCSTVSVARVVSTLSLERAFSAPNFEARSQNREADSKSSKDVDVCLPCRRYRTA
jgi:hypothetical protein